MKTGMADRFGANVKLNVRDSSACQLFYVRARGAHVPAAALAKAQGAKIVLQGGAWLLAEMEFASAMALKQSTGIVSVSGVSVDPQRFELFHKAQSTALPQTE